MEAKYSFKGIKQTLEDFQLLDQQSIIYVDLQQLAVFTTEQTLNTSSTVVEVFNPEKESTSPTSQKELRELCLKAVKENAPLLESITETMSFVEEYLTEHPIEFKNILKAVKAYNANSEGAIYLDKETLEVTFSAEPFANLMEIAKKEPLLTFKHNEKITNALVKTLCAIKYLDL